MLLPNSTDLALTSVELDPDCRRVTVAVSTVQACAFCPACHIAAAHVHSHYLRTLADLPWAEYRVRLQLTTRKWFCSTPTCPRRIFTERFPTIVAPWARRTSRLSGRQQRLGLALGGRAGARLAAQLDQPTSRATLLRFVRQTREPELATPKHLGVDDFAFLKGRSYGTILVDLDQGCPIDLLPDRTAATLKDWLQAHPGVELISRDRAGAYADGAMQGAPTAVQVADRWHILKNLGDALSRLFATHPHALPPTIAPAATASQVTEDVTAPGRVDDVAPALTPDPVPSAPLASAQTRAERLSREGRDRRQTRYDQIQALVKEGMSLHAIARHLHLSRGTIQKYARAATAPAVQARGNRASLLDPYKTFLLEGWNTGSHVGTALLHEIEARGYTGGRSIALDFMAAIRKQQGVRPMRRVGLGRQTASDPRVRPPTPRDLAYLVLQRPDRLDEAEQARLLAVRQADPKLALAVALTQEFATIVRERAPEALDGWLARAEGSGLAELRSFANGIRRDYSAVKAGVTLPYSNGVVEGNVNRLKYLKRQMYGRAKFDLLRKRVLYAA